MAREYSSGPSGHVVTDPDYPGIVATGRTIGVAEKEFDRLVATTWHQRRITEIQTILDDLLSGGVIGRGEYMKLQTMMDDFIGLLRERGDFLPAVDTGGFKEHLI